jgi:hypothetical protein
VRLGIELEQREVQVGRNVDAIIVVLLSETVGNFAGVAIHTGIIVKLVTVYWNARPIEWQSEI